MADESKVTISAWPKEPAVLAHQFPTDEPCPVSISFAETPARVVVTTPAGQPLAVDMNMNVTARKPIPVCISLCEPICARSDYNIGINIFDNPFAAISIRGMTRIENCREDPPPTRLCTGFDKLKQGTTAAAAFTHEGLTYTPLGGELRVVTFGEPAGRNKLAFAAAGVRVDFPQPANDLVLTVNNYAQPDLVISAFNGGTLLIQFTVSVENTVKEITFSQEGITAITVSGGGNEAALVELCYRPVRLTTLTRLDG